MEKFVVERNFPGASDISTQKSQALSEASNDVIDNIGKAYSRIKSYMTGDKKYYVHIAESEEAPAENNHLFFNKHQGL